MKKLIKMIVAAVALLSGAAWAGEVTEAQARTVAENFARGDSALKSRTVDAATRRGNLWIVSLKPNGYVAVSANDAAFPVPMHAEQDFVEPEEGSFQQLFLIAKDEDIGNAEGNQYASHWSRLLNTRKTLRLTTSSVASDFDANGENEIRLHLGAYWNQYQPYNDFSPMQYCNSVNEHYRGRHYAGCATIAYAQVMKFWQWPEILDVDVEATMPIVRVGGEAAAEEVTMRIKAGSKLDWASMKTSYLLASDGDYDLRGKLAETERQEIGRAIAFSTILSKAKFFYNGTGADLGILTRNDWYTETTRINHSPSTQTEDELFDDLKAILKEGCPIPFSIKLTNNEATDDGHAVVGVGWKKENNVNYIQWNMGWCYDSWVPYTGNEIRFKSYFKNHKPRPRPLMANVPARSTTPLTLNWHFPKKGWENDLTGFTVLRSEYSEHKGTWKDEFDTTQGESSGAFLDSFYAGQFSGIDRDSAVLSVRPSGTAGQEGYYTWTQPKSVSANSTLTFDYRSIQTRYFVAAIQVNPNDTGWEDLFTFVPCDSSWGDWINGETVSLAKYAGKNLKFRIKAKAISSSNRFAWTDSGARAGYVIDNFAVTDTDVVDTSDETEIAVDGGASARSAVISSGLEVGHRYAFRIRPNLTSGKGEVGDYVAVDIVSEGLAVPSFDSIAKVVSHTAAPNVQDGVYKECGFGLNYLDVKGSATMTQLRAYSSHTSILPDSAISVAEVPNNPGRYLVEIDTSACPKDMSRQRLILTLVGENDDGAVVQKDITLRISTETAGEASLTAADLDAGGGDDPGDEPDDPGDEPGDDPAEPEEEAPVVTPTFPKADDAGPNDDATAKTRFCPGVTKTSGWYDVNRTQNYNYLPPAPIDLVFWWVDRYKAANDNADPANYTAIDTSKMPTSDSGLTFIGYLDGLLNWCASKTDYFPASMTDAANWCAGTGGKAIEAGRQIYQHLANGPIAFKISTTSTYYGIIWGCDYAEDATGKYATHAYFTCSKSKNDGLIRKQLATGDNYDVLDSGALILAGYSGTMNGVVNSFYPISGPEPEASGDGEVTVKVTAGGEEFDISKAFSKVEKGTGNVVTYTLDATPGKKIEVGGEQISIQPELADGDGETPFEVQDGKLVFKVKSIPGLKYQVLASDSLDPDSFGPAGQEREATGTRRELTVTRSGETKGFYKIQVSR